MTEADNVISVKDLTKSFNGRTVVDHLTMSVKKGAIHGFLGRTAPARRRPSACSAVS